MLNDETLRIPNGKLDLLYSLKIDQDRANDVKCKILKKGSFNKEKHNFLTKTVILKVSSLSINNGFNGFLKIGDVME